MDFQRRQFVTVLPDFLLHTDENSGTFQVMVPTFARSFLIGGCNFLYEKYSKIVKNLFAIFGGFVYDNLKCYLM